MTSLKRVLIVDDDADILESLVAILEDSFEVISAWNGLEALRALEQQCFHAVVVDLTMPVMDGETLIEKMRVAGIVVPIVLASGISELRQLAERLGVEHIGKPYELSELLAKLTLLIADREP
jgi:DNA-binding response OmpR family regulator